MLKVAPMPDELAIAHEGRFSWVNCWVGVNATRNSIRDHISDMGHDPIGMSRLHRLALISGMSAVDYARLHSMLPVTKMFSKNKNEIFGENSDVGMFKTLAMGPQRRGAFCCSKCMNEDLEHWGFSWYRRRHHLIGVDWCTLHGCLLSEVTTFCDFDAFNRNPNHWLKLGMLKRLRSSKSILPENGFLKRYVDISETLLLQNKTITFDQAREMLIKRIQKIKRGSLETEKKFLIDSFEKMVPKKWFVGVDGCHIMSFHGKLIFSSQIPNLIDINTKVQYSSSFSMALATLYDSVEEMLADIEKAKNSIASIEVTKSRARLKIEA